MSKKIEKQEENIEGNKENTQSSDFSIKGKKELGSVLKNSNVLNTEKRENIKGYFQHILKKEEFEGLKRLVEDSNGIISWEKLIEKGVVKIEGEKIEGIYWKGNLDFKETKIESLWKLKKIEGDLNCEGMETLENIGDLEEVKGILNLSGTKIKTLNNLKKVERSLICHNAGTLEDLGGLEEVGGNLVLSHTNIKSLGKIYRILGGFLDISYTNIRTLGTLKKVMWGVYCTNAKQLKDMGELEWVGGELYISGTQIKTLGKVKTIGITFIAEDLETLEDLGDLQTVGESMLIQNAINLKTISILNSVGKNLVANGCSVELQLEIKAKIVNEQLLVKNEYIYDEYIEKVYNRGVLNIKIFEKVFGNDILSIDDEDVKKNAVYLLQKEYNRGIKEVKEKVEKIINENKNKKLTEEEKKILRKQIGNLLKNWEKKKFKLENFGVDLSRL